MFFRDELSVCHYRFLDILYNNMQIKNIKLKQYKKIRKR